MTFRSAWRGNDFRPAMRIHNPCLPLVFIHVPKTAGASVRAVFGDWYGSRLIRHYFDEQSGTPPRRSDLFDDVAGSRPVCVYGHFNRNRGFGVEANYPDAVQFVTVLRDPFELACSGYYFTRRVGLHWKDQSRVPTGDLRSYLETAEANMLNHFPRPVTRDSFRDQMEEFFVAIGITEDLDASMGRIAAQLGFVFKPGTLGRVNETHRDAVETETLAELRALWQERHPLEFEVYAHAQKLSGAAAPARSA